MEFPSLKHLTTHAALALPVGGRKSLEHNEEEEKETHSICARKPDIKEI